MDTYQQIRAACLRAGAVIDDGLVRLQRAGNPRQRLVGSTGVVLLLHGLVLWMLIAANPQMLPLREIEEQAIDTELYTYEPLPEPLVEPVPVLRPREVIEPEPQVEPEPQPQPDPVPVPQPAPETYKPMPKAITSPRENLDPVRNPTAKALTDRNVRSEVVAAPTVEAEPDPRQLANLKAKKKEEEGRIESKSALTARAPGINDLNLHETPMTAAPTIAPSGLASDQPGRSAGEGTPPAAGATGGGLKGGRSGITQALQNHESCVELQQAGKPIPRNCNMKELAAMKGIGVGDPSGRDHYGPIVAKKEAYDKYKRSPGNTDYWKRVNKVPTTKDQVDKAPASPGTYSNYEERRAIGECHLNNSC